MNEKSLEEVASILANAHRQAEPKTREVYLAPDKTGGEIRLVEVSDAVHYTGEVLPVRFRPKGDITFPSVVVLLSNREWDEVQAGKLALPLGWGDRKSLKAL
jgi:hypothetical protein